MLYSKVKLTLPIFEIKSSALSLVAARKKVYFPGSFTGGLCPGITKLIKGVFEIEISAGKLKSDAIEKIPVVQVGAEKQ